MRTFHETQLSGKNSTGIFITVEHENKFEILFRCLSMMYLHFLGNR